MKVIGLDDENIDTSIETVDLAVRDAYSAALVVTVGADVIVGITRFRA